MPSPSKGKDLFLSDEEGQAVVAGPGRAEDWGSGGDLRGAPCQGLWPAVQRGGAPIGGEAAHGGVPTASQPKAPLPRPPCSQGCCPDTVPGRWSSPSRPLRTSRKTQETGPLACRNPANTQRGRDTGAPPPAPCRSTRPIRSHEHPLPRPSSSLCRASSAANRTSPLERAQSCPGLRTSQRSRSKYGSRAKGPRRKDCRRQN